MVFVKEQQESERCPFLAQVWMRTHSFQCGCFSNKQAAERWADNLLKRIVESDTIRELRLRAIEQGRLS